MDLFHPDSRFKFTNGLDQRLKSKGENLLLLTKRVDKQSAFLEMVKEHEGIIYKVSQLYHSNPEDQKDLYQEIIFQLWKSYDSFRGESKRSTWIYRVALNTSIRWLDQGKRTVKGSDRRFEEMAFEPFDPLVEQRLAQIHKEIEKLSLVEKGIILLYLEGKSHEEIALITGFSKTNVGSRISRIKQKLKDQINK